jgi:hypothetical protein
MQREPVAIVAAVVAVVQLIVPGLVIFGVVDFNVEQLAFVEVFVAAVSLAVGAVVARSASTPV